MHENAISKTITYIVFLFSIGIIGLSIISVIFPALIISQTYPFSLDLDPFETSPWLSPILISTILLLSFGFLYQKEKLPSLITNKINFILNFEISKKIAILVGISIISIYIGLSIPELFIDEVKQWPDYLLLESALEIWPSTDHWSIYIKEQNTRYVRMLLLDFSQDLLQNIKILPFVASISVVIFTALITIQISKKRLAGIIAMIILLTSVTFTDFDTIAVYENFWVLFYLLSLYVVQKKWFFSPAFYILSFFTKAFVAPYFMMTLYYTFRSPISSKKKFGILISYLVIVILSISIIFLGDTVYPNVIEIDSSKFFTGIATLGLLLRYDYFLLLIILPVIVGLTILAKNSFKQSDSIIMLILGTMIAGPVLVMFTNFYEILPYRFVPLIVFFAISIGLFFTKMPKNNNLKN